MRTLSFVPSTQLLWAEFSSFCRNYKKRVLSGVSVLLSHLPGLVYGKVPARPACLGQRRNPIDFYS